jgi:DnaJ-class molecular chaperone
MDLNRCPRCHGWGEIQQVDGEELRAESCFECDATGFVPWFRREEAGERIPSTRRLKDNAVIRFVLELMERKERNEE